MTPNTLDTIASILLTVGGIFAFAAGTYLNVTAGKKKVKTPVAINTSVLESDTSSYHKKEVFMDNITYIRDNKVKRKNPVVNFESSYSEDYISCA